MAEKNLLVKGVKGISNIEKEESKTVIANDTVTSIEEFWGKIPIAYRKQTQNAFESGTTSLKQSGENMVLYRYIGRNGTEKSFWYAYTLESPEKARQLFALPNGNSAQWIVKVKVKKGIPFVEGKVSSQIDNDGFGAYATGGGIQVYFLEENLKDIDVLEKFENPITN